MAVESPHSVLCAVAFVFDVLCDTASSLACLVSKAVLDSLGKFLRVHLFVGNGFRPDSRGADHGAPEVLIAKEGYDHGWLAALECDGCCSGAAVDDYGLDAREQ